MNTYLHMCCLLVDYVARGMYIEHCGTSVRKQCAALNYIVDKQARLYQ